MEEKKSEGVGHKSMYNTIITHKKILSKEHKSERRSGFTSRQVLLMMAC